MPTPRAKPSLHLRTTPRIAQDSRTPKQNTKRTRSTGLSEQDVVRYRNTARQPVYPAPGVARRGRERRVAHVHPLSCPNLLL